MIIINNVFLKCCNFYIFYQNPSQLPEKHQTTPTSVATIKLKTTLLERSLQKIRIVKYTKYLNSRPRLF